MVERGYGKPSMFCFRRLECLVRSKQKSHQKQQRILGRWQLYEEAVPELLSFGRSCFWICQQCDRSAMQCVWRQLCEMGA